MTEESNKEFRLIREANAEVRNLYPEAYVREDRWYERIFRRNQAAAQQIQQQQARQRRAQRDQQQQPPQQVITCGISMNCVDCAFFMKGS